MRHASPLRQRRLPLALAASVAVGGAAHAQGAPPPGTPTDVTYTSATPGDSRLHPRLPRQDLQPGQVFRAERVVPDFSANAAVGRIVVEVDRHAIPADGQTPVRLTVRLFDRQGQPLPNTVFATLEHSGGRLLLPGARTDEFGPRRLDADRATPGVQLKVEGGQAEFTLLAPDQAQDVRVRVSAGDQEAAGVISFVPELRPMVAAGLVEGIVTFNNKVSLDPVRRGDVFEQQLQAWSRDFSGGKNGAAARAAFFLKGTIRGDLLLTAAYDSDKETRTRLLRDVRPDEFYPVYGDASLKSFDARSGARFFVRVDKNRSYALYGDILTADGFSQPFGQGTVASLKQRSLGAYNRTATGLRAHHEQDDLVANAFVFNDTLRNVVEEFPSQGSGPYALRHNEVLEGSDKVEVIVRDRYQPSRIVSVRPLARLVDYTFEPFSGRILLASFLPSVDENLNPVTLRVSYEVDQGGTAYWAGGADAQWKVTPEVEIGGAVFSDRNRLAPYELLSANATWRIGERTAVVVEAAQSTSTVNTNPANQAITPGLAGLAGEVEGRAGRVELAHEGERTDARLFVGRSDSAFNNPAAPLAGGRGEAYASAGYKLTSEIKVYGEAWKSEDRNPGGGDRAQGGVGLRWNATERLVFDASVRRARETVGTQGNGWLTAPFSQTGGLTGSVASGVAGGALGWGQQVVDPATGLPVIVQGSLPPATTTLPAGARLDSDILRLGLGYQVSDLLRVGGEVESDFAGDARRRVALGADYLVAERTRLYGRYERQSGWVQLAGVTDTGRDASAFAFGVESSYLRDTQVFSEYRLRDAASGRDLQLASGIRHTLDLAEGWRVSLGAEQVNVLSGVTAKTGALLAGLDYTAHPLWRGTTRIELRRSGDLAGTAVDDGFDTALWQVMAARKLDRDWTLLARNYFLLTDHDARGDVLQDRAQVGLAYRDTDTNRVNALGKLEYKLESDSSNAAVGDLETRAWIVSTHADWHPSRPWWLTGRIAAKWQDDRFENGVRSGFRTGLLAGRVVYDVTEKWDVGLLAAAQFSQRGAVQEAYGVEVGCLLRQNLWLSAGLNFDGFRGDADLVGYEYTRSGAYLRLRMKFDETLFASRDREVNRSLDR